MDMNPSDADPPGLDTARLTTYLRAGWPGVDVGDLRATLVTGGRSNLTYVITHESGEFVLRRPPLGHVLATAHDMAREFRVISALAPTRVPVPQALLLCADDAVLGAPFYLMSRVPGEVLRSRRQTADLSDDAKRQITNAMIDALADLHAVDPGEVGLSDFGRPEGFLERQVRRWSRQLDHSRGRDLPDADPLRTRLADTVPGSPPPAVVHGDYRLDNIVVDPAMCRVTGVLDWEMATIGDPLTDLGLLITYWDVMSELSGGGTIADAIGPGAGFPHSQALLDRYALSSTTDLSPLPWYTAFACYKLAAILEGIHFRHTTGKTVGAGFDRIGELVAPLLARGLTLAAEAGRR